jgi:hypothetical protein
VREFMTLISHRFSGYAVFNCHEPAIAVFAAIIADALESAGTLNRCGDEKVSVRTGPADSAGHSVGNNHLWT